MSSKKSICILPDYQGVGGPASFQTRLTRGLQSRGIEVHHDPSKSDLNAILVIAGTRHLFQLRAANKRGVRIVQRLNGMNWTHKKVRTGIRHYIRAEVYNWLLSTIRRSYADTIAYQSNFTQRWWTQIYGETKTDHTVIYNGVDLNTYSPSEAKLPPNDRIRILVIEGHLGGGHEFGFWNVVNFCKQFKQQIEQLFELMVVGDVPASLREKLQTEKWIQWVGIVKRDQIPDIIRSSHLYMPCEINAACPNSLIESLACGTPVIGFNTGALSELVGSNAGKIIPYGASDSNLEPADVAALIPAANQILSNLKDYQKSARLRAQEFFNVDQMVTKYLQVLIPD
jgi:glycosyltransferase involved in cell wall biosynthesis